MSEVQERMESVHVKGIQAFTWVICLLSWFPRSKVMLAGYFAFRSSNIVKTSKLLYPLSTKSPRKM